MRGGLCYILRCLKTDTVNFKNVFLCVFACVYVHSSSGWCCPIFPWLSARALWRQKQIKQREIRLKSVFVSEVVLA